MNRATIIKKVLALNPGMKEDELMWRGDGRLEWVCTHGVGHTIYSPRGDFVHGCDGCEKGMKIL